MKLTIVLPQRYLTQKSQCVGVLNLFSFFTLSEQTCFNVIGLKLRKGVIVMILEQ